MMAPLDVTSLQIYAGGEKCTIIDTLFSETGIYGGPQKLEAAS